MFLLPLLLLLQVLLLLLLLLIAAVAVVGLPRTSDTRWVVASFAVKVSFFIAVSGVGVTTDRTTGEVASVDIDVAISACFTVAVVSCPTEIFFVMLQIFSSSVIHPSCKFFYIADYFDSDWSTFKSFMNSWAKKQPRREI